MVFLSIFYWLPKTIFNEIYRPSSIKINIFKIITLMKNSNFIDEQMYSRQIVLLGFETMQKISKLSIL